MLVQDMDDDPVNHLSSEQSGQPTREIFAPSDTLSQELEEKRRLCDQLHCRLDSLLDENDLLREQLREKEQDLEKAVLLLKQNESLSDQLKESEARNSKLKQLAVKLKKEIEAGMQIS